METSINKISLSNYLDENQVVCQYTDELIEVIDKDSKIFSRLKRTLLHSKSILVVTKREMSKYGYELADWSDSKDVLLQTADVLICINKKDFETIVLSA